LTVRTTDAGLGMPISRPTAASRTLIGHPFRVGRVEIASTAAGMGTREASAGDAPPVVALPIVFFPPSIFRNGVIRLRDPAEK
jgi:hypothetical protein